MLLIIQNSLPPMDSAPLSYVKSPPRPLWNTQAGDFLAYAPFQASYIHFSGRLTSASLIHCVTFAICASNVSCGFFLSDQKSSTKLISHSCWDAVHRVNHASQESVPVLNYLSFPCCFIHSIQICTNHAFLCPGICEPVYGGYLFKGFRPD